jgi:Flp pilus assembly protein CpaB
MGAAVGTFALATREDATQTTSYVIATEEIAAGTALNGAPVAIVQLELPDRMTGGLVSDVAELAGSVATARIPAGALISASTIDNPPAGVATSAGSVREVALQLNRAGALAGKLDAGDLVDVLSTTGTGANARTDVVVRGATVVAVDNGSDSIASAGTVVVRLALTSGDDVLAAVHAAEAATATLVRSTHATDVLPDSYQLPTTPVGDVIVVDGSGA